MSVTLPCSQLCAGIQAGLGAHVEAPEMVLAAGPPAQPQSVTGMGSAVVGAALTFPSSYRFFKWP